MRVGMRRITGFVLAIMSLCMAPLIYAQDEGQKAVIQKGLQAQFTLTTVTKDRADIVSVGSILVLHKDGLLMYETSSPRPPLSTYKNGKVTQGWGGFGRDLGITMLAPGGATSNSYAKRKFVDTEKFWITGYNVQIDGVLLQFYSDPYDNIRYYGELKIPYPKGGKAQADDVLKIVAEVVTADNPVQEPAPPPPVEAAPPVPAASFAPVAPPPLPEDTPPAPTKTVSLGQTKDQVVAILGQPQKVANLGAKEIDYYSDMKVIFVHGKVADIQ